MAGGAASLIIPLLGVLYIRWNETRTAPRQADAQGVFQQREGERRITPPAAPAMAAAVAVGVPAQSPSAPPTSMMPTSSPLPGSKSAEGSGSLGFIKPSDDYYNKPAETPAPVEKKEEAKPAAAAPEEPKPEPKTAKKTKPAKKSFAMPKLNTTKGFTSFKRNAPGAQAAADEGGGDMADMLKNLPPGAENDPRLQEYLRKQGK